MQAVISSPQEGSFRLQQMSDGLLPGIQKNETDTDIEVTYHNRFTVYSQDEQSQRSMLQTKTIKTSKAVPRLGVMLVGLGGNNGSTFTAGVLANKRQLSWRTRNGE